MAYRKFRADLLFTGNELLGGENVLITDDNGIVQEVIGIENAGEDIENFDGLLTPGFINTHCHLELSHMKSVIPPGTGLVHFLSRVIKERQFDQYIINDAIKRAEAEMYFTGTVAVADICNTTDSIPIKQTSAICWKNFIEVIGFTEEKAEDRFQYALRLLGKFRVGPSKLKTSQDKKTNPGSSQIEKDMSSFITPHAPYSVSEKLFKLINQAGPALLSIHNQETESENQLYKNAKSEMFELYRSLHIDPSFFKPSGNTSLQTFLPWLNNVPVVILVHNTCTSVDDIHFIKQLTSVTRQEVYFSTCINANRYIETTNPPLELLVKNNCLITIGTDSYASNFSLNMLNEMLTIQNEFGSAFSLFQMLQWATINGAKALKLEARFGSFEQGKQPGVVLIDKLTGSKLTPGSSARRVI